METVRIRLAFEDRHLLNKTQNSVGLNRSWLLLKPQLKTISDLSSYLLDVLNLQDACPQGLLLYMDGFVLPAFESICILKDKDLICVKRQGGMLSDVIKVVDGVEEEIVDEQPVHSGVKLLANEEFEKETGGYHCESEDYEIGELKESKKLKDTAKQEGTKGFSRKRKRLMRQLPSKREKKCVRGKRRKKCVSGNVEKYGQLDKSQSHHQNEVLSQKSPQNIGNPADAKCTADRPSSQDLANGETINESSPDRRRICQVEKDFTTIESASDVPSETKKGPSRSSRRKKAKRKWRRELAKAEKKEIGLSESAAQVTPIEQEEQEQDQSLKGDLLETGGHENCDKKTVATDSDAEDNLVPVVVRPGHIRFLSPGKELKVQKNQVSVVCPTETLQWNGITSKKRGQKWGMEKASSYRRSDYRNSEQEISRNFTDEEEVPINDQLDYDKLALLDGMPKVGDVIAYRLLELTSSWCPELSSFRVGKVSLYDPGSSRIMLSPVPQYPFVSEKRINEDASAPQPEASLYNEDGSLEIDFQSLADVRLVQTGNLNQGEAEASRVSGVYVGNPDVTVSWANDTREAQAPSHVNGQVNVWDELSEALNAKKTQLLQVGGTEKESMTKASGSSKTFKSSALGPTMARLRAQNAL